MRAKWLVGAALSLAVAGAGTVVALTGAEKPAELAKVSQTQPKPTQPKPEAVTTNSDIKAPEPIVDSTPSVQPQATVQPAPVVEKPKYGEDPNKPGNFIVFDKQWAMEQSGLAQFNKKDEFIGSTYCAPDSTSCGMGTVELVMRAKGNTDWVYKGDYDRTICGTNRSVMENILLKRAADTDFDTNPITQLKWCLEYANSKYGSWYNGAQRAIQNPGRVAW